MKKSWMTGIAVAAALGLFGYAVPASAADASASNAAQTQKSTGTKDSKSTTNQTKKHTTRHHKKHVIKPAAVKSDATSAPSTTGAVAK